MDAHDQNSAEQVIVFCPTDIFANKILNTFRGMIQWCLVGYWIIYILWKDMKRQMPQPLCESQSGKYCFWAILR